MEVVTPMHKVLRALFPVLMVLNGIIDLAMPDQFKDAMDALTMPHYMLVILGVAKIAGGFALLLPVPLFLKEWAFAGFFIWWMGGLSAHAFSGHPPSELRRAPQGTGGGDEGGG
jgi:uncharacterized membrane protein